MLEALDIPNEAVGRLIGPAARLKCDMRYGVPFENERLEKACAEAMMDYLVLEFAVQSGLEELTEHAIVLSQELSLEAAYISWYGREGTP